ncbi:hypothetical protein SCOCK_230109 [Actinacidiphila cocklensis]|uniref:Uncharacterized protein n=1 Tax=Actinacidiphila cocklensis TaxID=887465 RepID=A0A9W4GRR6_9ACTN|nr:hypothetical protein SCOCK_230109 [Actinacidiphila cocklensis]
MKPLVGVHLFRAVRGRGRHRGGAVSLDSAHRVATRRLPAGAPHPREDPPCRPRRPCPAAAPTAACGCPPR